MLSEKETEQIREELLSSKRPLFFFHDDPDGLASFLLLYRLVNKGKGIVLKAKPNLTEAFAKKAIDYGCDKIFVLDIAMIDQEFIDAVRVPVIWIDHHTPIERKGVKYFNPRLKNGIGTPVSYVCYQVAKKDIWIATLGCISDWFMPDFAGEFKKKYAELWPDEVKRVEDALFATKLGELVKIFSFNLKGKTSEVNTSVKILTRIEHPNEIIKQESPRGKLIYKKYLKINKTYNALMATALKHENKKDKLLVFTYREDKLSLTKDLANELLYRFPDKIIILGRIKSGEVRCSLRSGPAVPLANLLQKALVGIQGYGGGHEQACGAAIKQEDFGRFVENLRKELQNEP